MLGLVLVAMLLLPGMLIAGIDWLGRAVPNVGHVANGLKGFVAPALFGGLALFRFLNVAGPAQERQEQPRRWVQSVLPGLGTGLVVFLANGLLGYVSLAIVGALIGPDAAQALFASEQEGAARFVQEGPLSPWLLFLLLSVVTPIAEELFFRGYVYRVLRHHFRHSTAAAVGSLIFAAFHFYIVQALPIFVAGLLFTLIYERTGTLTAPITAHATVNSIVLFLLLR